ncbi:hypothetical protein [Marinimicrobium agarilyticum]|uniref:hypothetical protein n=1 Tax=Marinimicrobium agarilyticum TaxID=306546 RepID=UPI00048466E4|nr:hypothetical protein [Marinimicrobium agarilyticum]
MEFNSKQTRSSLSLTMVILSVVLTSLAVVLNLYMGSLQEPLISGAIGRGLFPIIFSAIVVGLFQIGRRFRSRRSRWVVYTWTMGVLFVIALLQAVPVILTGGFWR